MVLTLVVWVGVVGIVVAGVLVLLRYLDRSHDARPPTDTELALAILRRRLAEGEIDAREFDEVRTLLREDAR